MTVGQELPGNATKANAILAAEANAVVNLIQTIQAQSAQPMMARGMNRTTLDDLGADDGTDGVANSQIGTPLNTNELYLSLTNVCNGFAYGSVGCCTNVFYALLSAPNLLTPWNLWQFETGVLVTDTNATPFTVPTLGRQNLCLGLVVSLYQWSARLVEFLLVRQPDQHSG